MSYLCYLLLLDIHIFYHFANKRIPHALMVIKRCDLKQEISCSITIVLYKLFFFFSVLDTTLCDKVCQRPAAGRWFLTGYSGFLHK